MISVLGLELNEALRRLQSVGVSVLVTECASRKGVQDADSKRVIRQTESDGGVCLVYANFLTTPKQRSF